MATSAQAAPQTYAEYAVSLPSGEAGTTRPASSEPLAGETLSQALKPGAKSNSIIVSPRQVRRERWGFGVFGGGPGIKITLWAVEGGMNSTHFLLRVPFIHSFIRQLHVGLRVVQFFLL
jgi:hypothetical protein